MCWGEVVGDKKTGGAPSTQKHTLAAASLEAKKKLLALPFILHTNEFVD